MDWAQRVKGFLDAAGQPENAKLLTLAATLLSLILLLALIAQSIRTARLHRRLAARTLEEGAYGLGPARHRPPQPQISLEGVALAPIDHIFPRQAAGFLTLVLLVSVGTWLTGLALAPDLQRFFTSVEWYFQPFYLAAHFITLRLFINVYTRNYAAGVVHLDIPGDIAKAGTRLILGPAGAVAALAIAIPFCWFDFLYLYTDRYQKMGGDGAVRAIDHVMWGIWCVEWFINALVWVILLGFLVKNSLTILGHPFRAPIHVVLHDKHYRPFLQMSSQGATIVLGFSAATVIYIWQTGGELTDYLGLAITGILLVLGFVPPWLLLKSKVDRAVIAETVALRRSVTGDGAAAAATAELHAPRRPLEQRLDEALALLRLSYLENLHGSLGQTEAKAILLRLLAPALTIAWQLMHTHAETAQKVGRLLQGLMGR